jgi:hypothetical protein
MRASVDGLREGQIEGHRNEKERKAGRWGSDKVLEKEKEDDEAAG